MKGIDISNYQAGLDLSMAKSGGIEFAICKISEGRAYQDRQFEIFYNQALLCDLPIGAYVYSHATTPQGAIAEAKTALLLLKNRKLSLGVFMDIETNGQMEIPKEQLKQTISAFCQTIEDAGYRSGIYGSEYNLWARVLPSDFPNSFIWIAHYGKPPALPCDLWQKSDSGLFPGYSGPVDTDEVMSNRMTDIIKGKNDTQEITEPKQINQSNDVLLIQIAMKDDGYWPGTIDGVNTLAWREAFKTFAGDVLGIKIQ